MKNRKIDYGIAILLFFLGSFFLFRSCQVHGKNYQREMIPDSQIEISYFNIDKALSEKDRAYYEKKRQFHKENAERTYQNAKNACWYLPRVSDREKARTCFTTAVGYIAASTPKAKLVILITSLLVEYGLDAMREWEYIEDQLHWCQHHSEMYEFYCDILARA